MEVELSINWESIVLLKNINAIIRQHLHYFVLYFITGFEGQDCLVNINDCKNDSCVTNATCIDGVNNFTCQCPIGYYGEFCHLEIDECQSNPCQNNGTCEDLIGGFSCSCETGFNGSQCENNIDDCPPHGCNNGSCVDGVNSFRCECNPGFNGTYCEMDINECEGKFQVREHIILYTMLWFNFILHSNFSFFYLKLTIKHC